MNNLFYTGIVEARNDPLKLGRVRVRVFGVHSEIRSDVPTESLPWANVLRPSTSASISGIGHSGTQFVEGTMVYVFFSDGESKQMPVVIGSIPGVPLFKSPFGDNGSGLIESLEDVLIQGTMSTVQATSEGTLLDSSGQSVLDGSGQPIQTPNIDTDSQLKAALGQKESSNNYKAVNQLGYIGKYQFGAPMLTDLGYVKKGTTNKGLDDSANWIGKDGVSSKDQFLNSEADQEKAIDAELKLNDKRLRRMGVIDESTTDKERAGYLATSHLLGTGGARDMKNGIVKRDGNGVTGNSYYNLGYAALDGQNPVVSPDNNTPDNPSRSPSVNANVGTTSGNITSGSKSVVATSSTNLGFVDSSGTYPRYTREQDTNRLSRGQNIDKTVVAYKEETTDKNVRIACGGTWDQSPVPYNAKYPFNQVYESESGHLLEFDDTPGNERVHLYHKSGTFTEIDRNGTRVNKIIGDNYEIIERNGYVHIKGALSITVEGNANILVSNNCNLEVNGDFNADVSGDVNWAVGGDFKVKTGGVEHHTSSSFAVDGAAVNLNSGVSTAGSLSTPSQSASGLSSIGPLSLDPRGFEDLSEFEADELSESGAAARQEVLAAEGLTDTNTVPSTVESSETVPMIITNELPVECSMFTPGSININEFVSPNFRLRDLTNGEPIPASQGGMKDIEIACNLKALALNVLEPIKAAYPDMYISSCLRPMGSNPRSQHPLGMAADVRFRNMKSGDYITVAKQIYSTCTVDQLILEYRSSRRVGGEPVTWIHASFSRGANRKQVFTMDNDKRISDFGEFKVVS